jgi:hypothetical protein
VFEKPNNKGLKKFFNNQLVRKQWELFWRSDFNRILHEELADYPELRPVVLKKF